MKTVLFAVVSLLLLSVSAWPQTDTSRVVVRVILVDKDLNQKPVPHLTVVLSANSGGAENSHETKTDFTGNAEIQAPPGKYRLSTPQGLDYQGRHYAWDLELNVAGESAFVDLSNDNARVTEPVSAHPVSLGSVSNEPARKLEDLTLLFQKYQKSVVTVGSPGTELEFAL